MRPLDRLTLNLDGIELREPTDEVGVHEEVICTLPESLQPLWSFLEEVMGEHDRLHEELPRGATAIMHEDEAKAVEHRHLHATIDYAQRLFAERLEHELEPDQIAEITESGGVRIRAGWKLVKKRRSAIFIVGGPMGAALGRIVRVDRRG
jgi:hypothetical protein